MNAYIGIDPGLHGGLAIIDASGVLVLPMPLMGGEIDGRSLATQIKNIHAPGGSVIVALEKVSSMPGQGVSSTFTFGKGFGLIQGVCAALGVRLELVTPQAWKKLVLAGLIPERIKVPKTATPTQKRQAKAANKKAQKDAAIAWCNKAYPTVSLIPQGCRVIHDGLSDALAIAEFAKRTYI